MNSLILRLAARALFFPLLLLAFTALYRGHHLPGGGFIGGLLASAPFVLLSLAEGVETGRRWLRITPVTLMALGLAAAAGASIIGLVGEGIFFGGMWLPTFTLPGLGTVHLGTPLLFDVGVFLTVAGFSTGVIFNLEDLD